MQVHKRCRCNPTVTCNLYHPVDADKSYGVSFPKSCFVSCCGASHGWLIFMNSHDSLVLYNPVTLARIGLPPVTDIYSSEGNLDHRARVFSYEVIYQKAVLSCSPSKGSGCVVMIIHCDRRSLSFVKAGQKRWQLVSTLRRRDHYLDCVYHKGSFYTVTKCEMVETWRLDGEDG
jgi:hypothetical protein